MSQPTPTPSHHGWGEGGGAQGERDAIDVTAPSLRNTVYHSLKYLLSIYNVLDTILGAGTQKRTKVKALVPVELILVRGWEVRERHMTCVKKIQTRMYRQNADTVCSALDHDMKRLSR